MFNLHKVIEINQLNLLLDFSYNTRKLTQLLTIKIFDVKLYY